MAEWERLRQQLSRARVARRVTGVEHAGEGLVIVIDDKVVVVHRRDPEYIQHVRSDHVGDVQVDVDRYHVLVIDLVSGRRLKFEDSEFYYAQDRDGNVW